MTALFFYLSRYPPCYKRLATEVRSTFKQGTDIRSGSKLSGCSYLRACIDEALRITPPIGATLWREAYSDGNVGPIVIDGHIVPPGTQVGVNVYSLHHNEVYFPEPFTFKPERWVDDQIDDEAKRLMHDAFSPFSIGARGCIGKSMAYLEASLVIAKTLWYFDFDRPEEESLRGFPNGGEHPTFQTGDQFGSSHTGPHIKFRFNGEAWEELVGNDIIIA